MVGSDRGVVDGSGYGIVVTVAIDSGGGDGGGACSIVFGVLVELGVTLWLVAV